MTITVRTSVSLVFSLVFCCGLIAQNERGPATPEERARAVHSARFLESNPFHKDAKQTRQWFILFLIEVPDIAVQMCTDYLPALYGKKQKNLVAELAMQMTYSSAAFIIEHPGQAKNKVAVNLAGLEGTLKMYESILKLKPKATNDFLDQLIAKRDEGGLKAYVKDIAANKCKGNKK